MVETTLEPVAKEPGIGRPLVEREEYGPELVVIGEGWVPRGLDESLEGVEPGQALRVEVPPEKGYGERDLGKVRLIPLRRFRAEGITPTPGMQVTVEGKAGIIRSVGAGRVQVDFNHPLAGKTLVYEATVEKVVEDREEKVRLLVARRIKGIEPSKFRLKLDGGSLTVEVPEEAIYLEGIQLMKKAIAADIEKFLPEVQEVSFIERFKKAQPPTMSKEGAQVAEPAQGAEAK